MARVKDVTNPDQLVQLMYRGFGGVIAPMQVESEIRWLMEKVSELRPKVVVEIGTATGGTLFLWTRLAAADATVISVDLPEGKFGGGWPRWKGGLYRAMRRPGQRLELLRGDSHDAGMKGRVMRILGGRPIDFLFVDGDHSYEGVRRDYEDYGPLVRPGGLIAFHDVARHPAGEGGDVWRFWEELRAMGGTQERVEDYAKGYGIGVVTRMQ